MTLCYIINLFLLFQFVYTNEDLPQVTVQQGTLSGYVRKTVGDRRFLAFQSIPYAEPPLGNLRFKPPTPGKKWNGVLNATERHAACPQMNIISPSFEVVGEEDCLYLNVYTPKISKNLLPVIIYIHGGGFTINHANPDMYGPDILLDRDLVLITLNYRLGPLGFLSLENDVLPGNMGLKDQSAAIKWVRQNVIHFGGDPDKLTVAGNSAGGASVYFHMVSSLTKDLLFAGISSSGTGAATWIIAAEGEARRNAIKLAEYLDCPTTTDTELLECLLKVDAKKMISQCTKFTEFGVYPLVPFKPVLETGVGAFLTELPIESLKSEKIAKIPFMGSVTKDDGAIITAGISSDRKLVEQLNEDFDRVSRIMFMFDKASSSKIEAISKFYFDSAEINESTMSKLSDALTDSLLYAPQRIASELHYKYTNQPAYFYLFGYAGSNSYGSLLTNDGRNLGVVHCDDLLYVFSNEIFKNYKPTRDDLRMNEIMTTLWYNFANTGNPTPEINSLITSYWEPVELNKFKYYSIENPGDRKTKEGFREPSYEFWKNLNVYPFFTKVKDEL